jgi:hypothetical protein
MSSNYLSLNHELRLSALTHSTRWHRAVQNLVASRRLLVAAAAAPMI